LGFIGDEQDFQDHPETENANTQNLSILSDNLLCRPQGMAFWIG